MRKFAYSLIACVASVFVAQSFAQPRDLFAEFEAEAEAAQSSAAVQAVPSSSSVAAKTAPAEKAPVAKPAPASSSSAKVSSSSIASSSSVKQSSSSLVVSSSSVAPSSSSVVVSSSSEVPAPVDSAAAVAEAPAEADSALADTLAGDSVREMTPEEAYAAEMRRHNEENRIRDSLAMAGSSSSADVASSSSVNRRELLGPVKVSKVNGIDEMKGRYKSPRKALFMSLVVPGSGQMYVGGSKFTYARGGLYLALEAGLWGGWYYFSVNKYDKQVDKYKKFAQTHYSIGLYEKRMRGLYNADAVNYESEFRRRYLGTRETFCEGIYGTATTHRCYDRDKLYSNDAEYVNDFVKNPKSLKEEMKNVSFDSPAEVYQLIADDAYVLGWDDIGDEDVAVATSLALEDPNHATEPLAKSESSNQKKYRSMRGKANDYADMQAWFFGGLILNHIISAVDAAITANSHNKALYEEDLSWYDHLHFDSGLSFVDGFGFNVQASWGF